MPRKPSKPKSSPASAAAQFRRRMLEQELCKAIKARAVVRLRYWNEPKHRFFAPYVVYRSTASKVLVYGLQVKNDAKPLDPSEPRSLEVGGISNLSVTGDTFRVDPKFSSSDSKYRRGVVCAIDRV